MLRGLRLSFLIPATFLTGHAQWLNYPAPGIPRTKDGKPDLFAKAPKLAGRPDLGDRLYFRARRHYCVQGLLAPISTVALLIGRREGE